MGLRRRTRYMRAPKRAPITGAVRYIQILSKFLETIAGPNDLAGLSDPPEIGLHSKITKKEAMKVY